MRDPLIRMFGPNAYRYGGAAVLALALLLLLGHVCSGQVLAGAGG